MIILYIDTSSSFLYSAISKDNKIISSISEEYGQNLSEVALPRISEMFEHNKISTTSVDKIIVVNGPGSFTGIRIGITIAKVYAWAMNIPITTITSLEAMSLSSDNNKVHVPIINARRGYVYAAIFDENQNIIKAPKHIKFSELKEELKEIKDYEFISNDSFEDEELVLNKYVPNYEKIISNFADKENINPHAINPDYLKLTEAEESNL